MSQEKAQLIAPQGHFTVPGLNVAGVVTASSFSGNCTGTASSLTQGSNVVVGVMTASSFAGDVFGNAAGLSTTTAGLKLGIVTATSFAGNFTGIGSGLTGTPNIVAGLVTATQFVGNTPGLAAGISGGKNLNAGIITSTSFSGNLTGNATGLSTTTAHVNLGIVTATSFHGSGANLGGVSSGPVAQQLVNANSGTTTVDLSNGNLIYFNQSSDTTVSFANTEGNTDVVYFVRVKDATVTARAITWPSTVSWNGGSKPTLLNINNTGEGQVFKLTTRDNGATWYGVEIYSNDGGKALWGMGAGYFGQLGQNEPHITLHSSPVQVSGTWKYAASGYNFAGAIKPDGTLWAWGSNAQGQLGVNDVVSYSSPVQVPGTTWSTSAAGGTTTYAVKSDGTLWAWGDNERGEVGDNSVVYKSSPVQIPGTTWGSDNKLSAGTNFCFAIKTDGTMWSWGSDGYGSLAQNTAHPAGTRSSPVQVPGTNWSMVCANQTGAAAIKTDGTLWAWGMNQAGGAGSLGQNDIVDYSSPVQIPGTTWSKVFPTAPHSYGGVKTDGTLWAWGYNNHGQLGQNNQTHYSSPVQIPGTNWSNGVSSGNYAAFGVKTDGTAWKWGRNEYGQLGLNSRTYYSSPVQLTGTWNVDNIQNRSNASSSWGNKS